MQRKQMVATTNGGTETPLSPASTGAMDTLLEKLRAAAPQTRDQRDRRRRARLKDKHQVRVASGQKMPDIETKKDGQRSVSGATVGTTAEDAEEPLTSPDSDGNHVANSNNINRRESGSGLLSPFSDASEADVADRAASLLQGLRGSGIGASGSESNNNVNSAVIGTSVGTGEMDDSLRVRRRRESADNERTRRRARRAAASAAAAASAEAAPSLNRSSGAILEEVVRANMNDAEGLEDERKQQQEQQARFSSNRSSYYQESETSTTTEGTATDENVDETVVMRQLPSVTEEEGITGDEASKGVVSSNGTATTLPTLPTLSFSDGDAIRRRKDEK